MKPSSFDAVVIGAGLGGLAAAVALRRSGLTVLVVDRNPHPGGTAWCFRRGGFSFPMGPLGFSSPGEVEEILSSLGSGGPLPLVRVHYRLRAFGVDLPLSLPPGEEALALSLAFPGEGEAIRAFFAWEGAGGDLPASAWLAERAGDLRLRRILASQGTGEAASGMALARAMWRLLGEKGIWTLAGGKGVGGLAERLLPLAGEVRLGAGVRRIAVERGRVKGVVLGDGTAIPAPLVVSNADFKTTFLELMEAGDLPGDFRASVAGRRLTGSCFQVSLGLDRSRVDLSPFLAATRVLWRREGGEGSPPRWGDPLLDPGELASQEIELALVSGDDPALCPPGGAALVIRTAADYRHFARFRTGHRGRAPGYLPYKLSLADALVKEAETFLPGLAAAVMVREVSTPLTFEDQGGRSEGAVAGWSWDWEDGAVGEPRDLTRSPVKGLFLVGHQARSALHQGGVATALASGAAAVRQALKE